MHEDVMQIRSAAKGFLEAFDNLDRDRFRATWASNPTVFFPFDDTPERVDGKAAVEARFERFFDEVRATRPGPPYLHLEPRDLRVEAYGEAALVTFMLDRSPVAGSPPIGRRTLLFVREAGAWKLAHLHASVAGQVAKG